jgi:hypothetical protein
VERRGRNSQAQPARPPGPRMKCGRGRGSWLTGREMRAHFTICAKRPAGLRSERPGRGLGPGSRYAERSLPLHVGCLLILPERYKVRMAKVIFPGPFPEVRFMSSLEWYQVGKRL